MKIGTTQPEWLAGLIGFFEGKAAATSEIKGGKSLIPDWFSGTLVVKFEHGKAVYLERRNPERPKGVSCSGMPFGSLVISCRNGEIVHLRREENIKP